MYSTLLTFLLGLAALSSMMLVKAAPYNESWVDFNFNLNPDPNANISDFTTRKLTAGNDYHPSPTNWRNLPAYTILLDKLHDGDPRNNDYFKTIFEYSGTETQLRHGGDITGMVDDRTLDYMEGMGLKVLYISGTPFLNLPWQADGYSALDFTLLDPHWGTLDEWAKAIDKIHGRGMYLVLDFTISTMGNLLYFEGYENSSAPFNINEYDAHWNRAPYGPWGLTEYPDFKPINKKNDTCELPIFWDTAGNLVNVDKEPGCYDSPFDHYGDMEAFGVHPDWQRQLSKFSSVQDRLRDWDPAVADDLIHYACLMIEALDFDGIRVDKATQLTVDFVGKWANGTRTCARQHGKNNFYIPGEIVGGDTFGSLYIGRGRTPHQNGNRTFMEAVTAQPNQTEMFMREEGLTGYDSTAFHYSFYRSLTRVLQLDGNLDVADDIDEDFTIAWNQININEDMINSQTGEYDPRHWMGSTNHDIFRWPAMVNGTMKEAFASYIGMLLIPGTPLVYYGQEQGLYAFDNSAANYLFGRQAMTATTAWQRHACYKLGSTQYHNFEYGKSLYGCEDYKNQLDHFDPTSPGFRYLQRIFSLRQVYPTLLDGFQVSNYSTQTYEILFPGSNATTTKIGVRSQSRAPLQIQQNRPEFLTEMTEELWFVWHNENRTVTYNNECGGANDGDWIRSPYPAGTTVKNLLYPYDEYTLDNSTLAKYANNKPPYMGCLRGIELPRFGFKVFVPDDLWYPPNPTLTKFVPGHDHRLLTIPGSANETSFEISFEFDQEMNCDSLTNALKISHVGPPGTTTAPSVRGTPACAKITGDPVPELDAAPISAWSWTATIENASDGIYDFILGNVSTYPAGATSGFNAHLMVRKGLSDNPLVWTETADYNSSILSGSNNSWTLTHAAAGSDLFRYTGTYGLNWTDWQAYEAETKFDNKVFDGKFWEAQHVIVQYYSALSGSAAPVVHADSSDWTGGERRVPKMIARGKYNQFGYDQGVPATFKATEDGTWTLPVMDRWPSLIQVNIFGFDDYFLGDADGDGVMDRLPPNSLSANYFNMSAPPKKYMGWNVVINDRTGRWKLVPRGHAVVSLVVYLLLLFVPLLTAILTAVLFRRRFYAIKINKYGVKAVDEKFLDDEKAGRLAAGQKIIGWPEDVNKRRKIIIATLEYEILDWKIKVKIGGLGVMSKLMGTAMEDCDLVWVIPKVGGVDYPPGEPTEPISVVIFGEEYLIECEIHVYKNITYYILDSPVFRAQTKSDPYPARMDDLSSAVFYSTWNQAIAEVIRRNPIIDIYHINDYHGTLAPLYLLPKIFPTCLSLHNAEFQGLWPLRNKEEMNEVCAAFNLPKEVTTKYIQYGNTFNLLHAGAAFIAVHQKSVGVAGVSDKYGKRSWARYPALWTLKAIDSLPNPDPDDIAALDTAAADVKNIQIDEEAESKRPELKRQAQEWAGINQDPKAELFVFVGRWSKQKGVDIIADVFPALFEKNKAIQLIAVGPVIDLYGRFAAEKLARLMEMYPEQVFSKPEFTSLPPYLFSGADFALIPSRDEPFGLVAVEFGRKGALGVGARLGGLGLMPGWWFPVESTSTSHMISQLQKTIKLALRSTEQERAVLRARSAVQRFPVIEWRGRVEVFQKRAIRASRKGAGDHAYDYSDYVPPRNVADPNRVYGNAAEIERLDWSNRAPMDHPTAAYGSDAPSHNAPAVNDPMDPSYDPDDPNSHPNPRRYGDNDSQMGTPSLSSHGGDGYFDDQHYSQAREFGDSPGLPDGGEQSSSYNQFLASANRQIARQAGSARDPFFSNASRASLVDDGGELQAPARPFTMASRRSSHSSINSIVDEHGSSSPLNKAMETFTDENGEVAQDFVQKLKDLNSNNSKGDLCIEKYLEKAEKKHFVLLKKEKVASSKASGFGRSHHEPSTYTQDDDDNLMPDIPMTRMQIFMGRMLGEWPFYSIVMSSGQMLSATAFQLVLLSGSATQKDLDLYVVGAVFFTASICWWACFRIYPAAIGLAFPWIFFGLAFFLIGLPSFHGVFRTNQSYLQAVATWMYAIGSAAGFLNFGMNFGEEAGATTQSWIFRACVVQGLQQCWTAALWYWGSLLTSKDPDKYSAPTAILFVVWPLSVISFLFFFLQKYGLPQYYLQAPPTVPQFYASLWRRSIFKWFMVAEVLKDFWLAPAYGRTWSFLWKDDLIPTWATVLLIAGFFIIIWGALLALLTRYAKVHSWLLPVFAIGLGAPGWCQIFWATSGIGHSLPWAGVSGPYLSSCLWLWLGVLNAIQGTGLGMALLQTLSRFHVCAAIFFGQCLGAIVVMIARACSPGRLGPYTVFPNLALWDMNLDGWFGNPIVSPVFWVCLGCQLAIVVGYLWLFRKEQLSKP